MAKTGSPFHFLQRSTLYAIRSTCFSAVCRLSSHVGSQVATCPVAGRRGVVRHPSSRPEHARQLERLLDRLDHLLETFHAAQGIKAGVLADHVFKRFAATGDGLTQ